MDTRKEMIGISEPIISAAEFGEGKSDGGQLERLLDKKVTVDAEKSPDGGRLTVGWWAGITGCHVMGLVEST